MLNLLARIKQYFKEVFSNSINVFRDSSKKKELRLHPQLQSCLLFFSGQPEWLFLLFTIWSHNEEERKKKKNKLCFALTSKQVYKLIQRAVILKIFYV